ncbi:cytochrome P450 4d2-like [Culicoides brevitarsis]|uniref:cytochrome P450 4d2-like n=1 Tax=Culicoides brevitarsis TaxID=469753 RepID=UPI00307C1758
MFVLYAVLLAIPLFLYWLHQKQLQDDVKVGVLKVKGWPLIGSVADMKPFLQEKKLFVKLHELHREYGDTYQLRMGPVKMIISRDPKITEAIVNNPKFGKAAEYKMLRPWLGDSLVMSEGEKWHKMRKLITPAFHFQILERFIPVFEEQTDIMIDLIRQEMSNPKGIDVFPKFHNLTLDIISETSMGVHLNAQVSSHSPFIDANLKVINIVEERVFSGYLSVDWLFRLSNLYKIQKTNIAIINDFVDNVIRERHDKMIKEINENPDESETKKRPALLDILLQARVDGKPLSNEDIQAEVKTFMFAGHETTANTLSFVAYFLAKYPEVQEKMYDEIKRNSLDTKSESLTTRELNSLSYMDNVIKETLRLYPPGFMVSKRCHEDIRIGNVFIPKDSTIATNIYSGHRNEKYFKNPEEFNPDRFDTEISANERNPYVFQPFSSGLRNCIGQKFAMMEAKTTLVKLVSTFKLELAEKDFEIDVIQSGTLKSANGAPLIFKERN